MSRPSRLAPLWPRRSNEQSGRGGRWPPRTSIGGAGEGNPQVSTGVIAPLLPDGTSGYSASTASIG
jgi:hypothetical protein